MPIAISHDESGTIVTGTTPMVGKLLSDVFGVHGFSYKKERGGWVRKGSEGFELHEPVIARLRADMESRGYTPHLGEIKNEGLKPTPQDVLDLEARMKEFYGDKPANELKYRKHNPDFIEVGLRAARKRLEDFDWEKTKDGPPVDSPERQAVVAEVYEWARELEYAATVRMVTFWGREHFEPGDKVINSKSTYGPALVVPESFVRGGIRPKIPGAGKRTKFLPNAWPYASISGRLRNGHMITEAPTVAKRVQKLVQRLREERGLLPFEFASGPTAERVASPARQSEVPGEAPAFALTFDEAPAPLPAPAPTLEVVAAPALETPAIEELSLPVIEETPTNVEAPGSGTTTALTFDEAPEALDVKAPSFAEEGSPVMGSSTAEALPTDESASAADLSEERRALETKLERYNTELAAVLKYVKKEVTKLRGKEFGAIFTPLRSTPASVREALVVGTVLIDTTYSGWNHPHLQVKSAVNDTFNLSSLTGTDAQDNRVLTLAKGVKVEVNGPDGFTIHEKCRPVRSFKICYPTAELRPRERGMLEAALEHCRRTENEITVLAGPSTPETMAQAIGKGPAETGLALL